jgi:putative transposase
MPRRGLAHTQGLVLHVLNRGARRHRIFETSGDYDAWLQVLAQAQFKFAVQVFAFALMPNHYHLVLQPQGNDELPRFMLWVQMTHAKRWHGVHGTQGQGALYQGRYKAFPVQTDRHFLTVCRYVERNAFRSGLVARAQDWAWSSLFERDNGSQRVRLHPWPVQRPDDWIRLCNDPVPEKDLDRVRKSLRRSEPFGAAGWCDDYMPERQGRPRKTPGVFLRST